MKKKFTFLFVILSAVLLALTSCHTNKVEVPELPALEYTSERTLEDINLPEGWSWINEKINPTVDVSEYAVQYGKKTYTIILNITKATPSYVTNDPIVFEHVVGKKLSSITLLEGWAWKDSETVIAEGLHEYIAIFTPSDATNYNVVEKAVTINALTLPTLNSVVYSPSQKLSDIVLPAGWTWEKPDVVPTVDVSSYNAKFDGKTFNLKLVVTKATPSYVVPSGLNVQYVALTKIKTITLLEGWAWKNQDELIVVGINSYQAVFTPSDAVNYLTVELALEVVAYKDIVVPTLASVVYSPELTLANISLPENWAWKNESLVPTVNKLTYSALYTREDKTTVAFEVALTVTKATPEIILKPTTDASMLIHGDLITVLAPGQADIAGIFEWVNKQLVVSSGENIVEWRFVPSDENYVEIKGNIVVNIIARVKFVINVDDAILLVFDAAGNKVNNNNGLYTLLENNDYTYQVTKTGYVAAQGLVPNEGGIVNVNLEKPIGSQPTPVPSQTNNNGITNSLTPIEGELLWSKKVATGWTDAPSVQSIVDNSLIVMAGKSIIKYDLLTGAEIARGTMVEATNWGYTPATYAEGIIFAPLANGTIQAFNAKTLESLWIYRDPLKGQSLSLITYHEGYIYTGFWNSEVAAANFVAISITDEDPSSTNEAKIASWTYTQMGGFYWAGAVVVGNTVIVGTDDGTSSYDSPTSKLLSFNRLTGELVSSLDLIGDQRSGITYIEETGKIYFVSKNGYIYKADVNTTTGEVSNLVSKEVLSGWQSTSTPVVYNGRIYIGLGQGFSSGKIAIIDETTLEPIYTVNLSAYPQAKMLLSTAYLGEDGTVYIYTTYNGYPGGIYVITDKPGQTTANGYDLFVPDSALQQYCISTIIASNDGILYFKNDSGYVFAVKNVVKPTIETTLIQEKVFTNKNATFDVWAKDAEGNKLDDSNVTIKLNGDDVTSILWSDSEKTSYQLELSEYENILEVIATKNGKTTIVQYVVYFEEGPTTITVSIEAFTLGNGFLVDPLTIVIDDWLLAELSLKHFGYVDIGMMKEELRATYILDYVIETAGYTYYAGGTMSSSFYLSAINGFYHEDNIPQILIDKIDEEGGYIDAPYDNYSLGEFDYTFMSGWMYSVNEVFPNVGFADYYLQEGDVMRVQFTLYGYGLDLGAGGFWGDSFFEEVNKCEIIELLALIDHLGLERNEDFDFAYETVQIIGISQDELDSTYTILRNSYIDLLA